MNKPEKHNRSEWLLIGWRTRNLCYIWEVIKKQYCRTRCKTCAYELLVLCWKVLLGRGLLEPLIIVSRNRF